MTPVPPPSYPRLRGIGAGALWLLAIGIVGLVVAGSVSPLEVQDLATSASGWLSGLTTVALGATTVLLLVWPPFLPGLRVAWRSLRSRMSVDQGPMLHALARLQHFESAPDHLIVGRTQMALGQPLRALPHFGRALEIEPSSLSARHELGRALEATGQLPGAASMFGQVVAADPRYAFGDALRSFGRVLFKLGQIEQAAQVLDRFDRDFGADRQADLLRAKIALARNERDTASRLLARVVARPDSGALSPEDALTRAQGRVLTFRKGVM